MSKGLIGVIGGVAKTRVIRPEGDQPMYGRAPIVDRKSPRVIRRNVCMAEQLKGKTGGGRAGVRQRFIEAVAYCKREGR